MSGLFNMLHKIQTQQQGQPMMPYQMGTNEDDDTSQPKAGAANESKEGNEYEAEQSPGEQEKGPGKVSPNMKPAVQGNIPDKSGDEFEDVED